MVVGSRSLPGRRTKLGGEEAGDGLAGVPRLQKSQVRTQTPEQQQAGAQAQAQGQGQRHSGTTTGRH